MECFIMYYARVVFETDASVAERHEDISMARRWIDEERQARPDLFRCGQILQATPDRQVIATCDVTGWEAP
jgi:hypothetical protein